MADITSSISSAQTDSLPTSPLFGGAERVNHLRSRDPEPHPAEFAPLVRAATASSQLCFCLMQALATVGFNNYRIATYFLALRLTLFTCPPTELVYPRILSRF